MSQEDRSGTAPQRGLVPTKEREIAGGEIAVRDGGAALERLEDMHALAKWFVAGGAAPKGDSPATVLAKIQAGAELGITPMWAVSNITMINGRAGIMGDLAVGLVRSRKYLRGGTDFEVEYFCDEGKTINGTPKGESCRVTAHRRGTKQAMSRTFSIGEATDAKLIPADARSPWTRYKQRMLYYRALGFLLRDGWSDALKGIALSEELRDMPGVVSTPPPRAPALPAQAAAAGPDPLMAGAAPIDEPVVDAGIEPEKIRDAEEPVATPVADAPLEATVAGEKVAVCCAGCGATLHEGESGVYCPECGLAGDDAIALDFDTGEPSVPRDDAQEIQAPDPGTTGERPAAAGSAYEEPENDPQPKKRRRSKKEKEQRTLI
jgi:hypothetical protein